MLFRCRRWGRLCNSGEPPLFALSLKVQRNTHNPLRSCGPPCRRHLTHTALQTSSSTKGRGFGPALTEVGPRDALKLGAPCRPLAAGAASGAGVDAPHSGHAITGGVDATSARGLQSAVPHGLDGPACYPEVPASAQARLFPLRLRQMSRSYRISGGPLVSWRWRLGVGFARK